MTSSSDLSKISTNQMQFILESLKCSRNRDSTRYNYHTVWKLFSKFVLQLDVKPNSWEECIFLFLTYLVNIGRQSLTVKSYYSAIKAVLRDDNYELNENTVLVHTITRACKLSNDTYAARLPIRLQLLELILCEIECSFSEQFCLKTLYLALFALAYYGLFRIGELTFSNHVIKAKDIHIALNKNKILIFLYTSKMHDQSSRPQKVKITQSSHNQTRHFCPFKLVQNFLRFRGSYTSHDEQFFVFKGAIPMEAQHVRLVLKDMIHRLNLNPKGYVFHSMRAGHASDMVKWGFTIEQIKRLGRWKSNAIYKYVKL